MKERTINHSPQIGEVHYFKPSYDTKIRFISYWYQIREIVKENPKSILEIGIGNGFVRKYLVERGIYVTTVDIDGRLKPDILANVESIPVHDKSFSLISCCEVLEHLEFNHFLNALRELQRISILKVIISIPDISNYFAFSIQISKVFQMKYLISLPRLKQKHHIFKGEHYWEIGKKGYPLHRIKREIEIAGFTIEKTFRIFDNPYHRFFILKTTNTVNPQ